MLFSLLKPIFCGFVSVEGNCVWLQNIVPKYRDRHTYFKTNYTSFFVLNGLCRTREKKVVFKFTIFTKAKVNSDVQTIDIVSIFTETDNVTMTTGEKKPFPKLPMCS